MGDYIMGPSGKPVWSETAGGYGSAGGFRSKADSPGASCFPPGGTTPPFGGYTTPRPTYPPGFRGPGGPGYIGGAGSPWSDATGKPSALTPMGGSSAWGTATGAKTPPSGGGAWGSALPREGAGAMSGMAAGAALGSVAGPFGTLLGSGVGALAGGLGAFFSK